MLGVDCCERDIDSDAVDDALGVADTEAVAYWLDDCVSEGDWVCVSEGDCVCVDDAVCVSLLVLLWLRLDDTLRLCVAEGVEDCVSV
jgi:hypothetical protein